MGSILTNEITWEIKIWEYDFRSCNALHEIKMDTENIFSVLYCFGDRKGTTKKLYDKDFAERSGELSGAIRLRTPCFAG